MGETMLPIILTAVLVLCFLLACWSGYKRGLVPSIANLASIVVALYVACMLSAAFSGAVVTVLRPFAGGYMEGQISETVLPQLELEGSELSITDALAQHPEETQPICSRTFQACGIYRDPADRMAAEAEAYAAEQGTDILTAMVQVFSERLAYVGMIVVGFLLIHILLVGLGNLPNLTFRFRNRERLDDVGGTAVGALCGAAYCVLLCWALQFFGLFIGRETLEHTFLAKVFLWIDVLTLGVGI